MSGFNGPKGKVARALRIAVSDKTARILERRTYAPGQHGMLRKRATSEYYSQLKEKQRLRFVYNVSEAQMRIVFKQAQRLNGHTGENMLMLLETRLDAMVYRMGFARSVCAARQYVAHGHFEVDGQQVDIPSFRVRPGQVVALRSQSRNHPQIVLALTDRREVPEYLLADKVAGSGRLVVKPQAKQIPVGLDMQLVIEFYSR